MATADYKELRGNTEKKPRGRHFGTRTEDTMERDDEHMETPLAPSPPVGLNEEARDMRNAGRKLETQEPDRDIIGVAERLIQAVREQEANNRQHAKDMGRILDELRAIVSEVERSRSDAQNESRTAQQAAVSGIDLIQTASPSIQKAHQPARSAPTVAIGVTQELCARHRYKGERHHQRDDQRKADGERKALEHLPENALYKSKRQEYRHRGERGRRDGHGHFFRAVFGSFFGSFSAGVMAVTTFQHNDRVIHQHTDADCQAAP